MSRPFEDRRPAYEDRRGPEDRPSSRYDDRPPRSYDDRAPRSYDDRRPTYDDRRDYGYPGERRPVYEDRRDYVPERRDDRSRGDFYRGPPPPRDFQSRGPPRAYDRPSRPYPDAPPARNFQAQYPPRARAPNQLFVGSLAFAASDDDLRVAFPSAVSVRVQRERDSMRSRGFGFVAFATPEDAAEALRTLDGVEVCGRPVKLAEANQSGGPLGHREGPKDAPPRDDRDAGLSTRSRSRSRQRQASWTQEGQY